jgi:hypothetical protein
MSKRGFPHFGLRVLALLLAALPARAEVSRATEAGTGGPMGHIGAFQRIADANGGNRAAGTAGYDRSAQYVAERLRGAGYDVRFEEFTFPYFEERSPPILGLAPPPEGSCGRRAFPSSGCRSSAERPSPPPLPHRTELRPASR